MRRYHGMILVAAAAMMLSACSGKSDDPAKGKGTYHTEASMEPHTQDRQPEIQILEETQPETSAQATAQATADAGQTAAGTKPTETKAAKETESARVYSVEAFEKTMYATANVNVRVGYTMQSEVISCLKPGQKVKVTGRSANGWMRVIYDGRDAFVYQNYLSGSAPTPKPAEAGQGEPPVAQTQSPDVTVYPGNHLEDPMRAPGEIPIVEPAPIMTSPGQSSSVTEYGPGMDTPGGGSSWTEPAMPGRGPGM